MGAGNCYMPNCGSRLPPVLAVQNMKIVLCSHERLGRSQGYDWSAAPTPNSLQIRDLEPYQQPLGMIWLDKECR